MRLMIRQMSGRKKREKDRTIDGQIIKDIQLSDK